MDSHPSSFTDLSKPHSSSGPQCSHRESEAGLDEPHASPEAKIRTPPGDEEGRAVNQPQASLEFYSRLRGHWPCLPTIHTTPIHPIRGSPGPVGWSGPDSFTSLHLVWPGLPLPPRPLLSPPWLPDPNTDPLLSLTKCHVSLLPAQHSQEWSPRCSQPPPLHCQLSNETPLTWPPALALVTGPSSKPPETPAFLDPRPPGPCPQVA